MITMTLQHAKTLVGQPLNQFGDALAPIDVVSLTNLRNYIYMYHAAPTTDPVIIGDAVRFVPDELFNCQRAEVAMWRSGNKSYC